MTDVLVYPAYALTGGTSGCLDYYDGAGLADGEIAITLDRANEVVYFHVLDDDSGAAESSPDVIAPDVNAGDKRWILMRTATLTATCPVNIVTDTTPQLGGNLDTNEKDILIDTGHGIQDQNGNEQIKFSTTASAVNELTVKNAATGNGPEIQATGGDTNIDIKLIPKGSGGVQLADAPLLRPKLKDYSEAVNALGSGGGTRTVNLENGNYVTATVSTSTNTFVFSNPAASGSGCGFILELTNGGSQTVNWPASVDWEDGGAPELTASGVDILGFITRDGGTTWYGFVSILNAS